MARPFIEDHNCLKGCIRNYYCGTNLNEPGPAGKQAESFAPYVRVRIGDQTIITVGNKSMPPSNTAVIKSYEVGWLDTQEMTVEILDEAGGRFGALLDGLRKCAQQGAGTEILSQFGWVYTTCEGTDQNPVIISPEIRSIFQSMEVNYSEGKIKYRIQGVASAPIYADMREDKNHGEDGKREKLEDAIEALCAESPPLRVTYAQREADGKWTQKSKNLFNWRRFGKGGPEAVWQADNQNRIAVISKWIAPYRVEDSGKEDKGLVIIMDPITHDHIYIIKDPTLGPGEPRSCGDENKIGTFIVNGGKCSPVIEFTPKFNWIAGFANFSAGGDTASSANSHSEFTEGDNGKTTNQEREHGYNVGTQLQNTITQQAFDSYGPSRAHEENMKSQLAHAKANRLTEIQEPIHADLKILGDPRPQFVLLEQWWASNVSIVAINPFHLQGEGNKGCGDWLAQDLCNKYLSNKNWLVQGVNHSIKEGSYTTTLKLLLPTPGIEVGHDDPLGGVGSEGASVSNTCR
jgi:hypothetical protein